MSKLLRFTTFAALASAPFFFSGCQKDEPLPMNQEITGTATYIDLYSPYGGKLRNFQITFLGDDGRSYDLVLVKADLPDGSDYEANAEVSVDNFLTEQSIIVNKFDQRIETHSNLDYEIIVDVIPGAEMNIGKDMGGYKSFNIQVPSSATSTVNYSFGNEDKIKELFENREMLNETIFYLLDNIKNSPYEPGSKMGFSANLKLRN